MTLFQYRQKHGLTQADVAVGINTSVPAVSAYENGRIPKRVIMDRIVAFTSKAVTPNDFHGVSQ